MWTFCQKPTEGQAGGHRDIGRQGHRGPAGVASLIKGLATDKSLPTAPAALLTCTRLSPEGSVFLKGVARELLGSVFTPSWKS